MLDQIIDGLRDRLVAAAQAMVADFGAAAGNDASYYNGAAGIGFELLHHLDRPGVRDTVAALGPFAHAAALRTQLPPGLYLGTTGVQIFLRSLLNHGIQTPLLPAERLMPESWSPEDDDLLVGCAGLGLGHLMLAYSQDADVETHRGLAINYLSPLSQRPTVRTSFEYAEDDPRPLDGRAHGLAGVAEAVLRLATIEPDTKPAARQLTDRLVKIAQAQLQKADTAGALPLSVSWCRGLAGIGHTLVTAAEVLPDPDLLTVAESIGECCRRWLPQLSTPGQCCGTAGVGSYLLRLADRSSRRDLFLAAARQAAQQIMLRSTVIGSVPRFSEQEVRSNPASWSSGDAGILAFLRCLRAHHYQESLPFDQVGN